MNCHFDPDTTLKTVQLMKEALDEAGLKRHLMVQPVGYHTPDCDRAGFLHLPEYPFGTYRRRGLRFVLDVFAMLFREFYEQISV